MAERPNYSNNSQTLVVEADSFDFEAVEQINGHATVVRFQLKNPEVKAGDVLLVLSGGDIHFHGMIGIISDDGSAVATDRRGSLLPASTVQ
ncbi:MAG: hypothetical protein H0T45_10530 [Pyrinomonadaceae bacterium]|nr:hypothetical protein [Pyrinomonadaceae bacterium]MDQ3135633.1 hypothetical protein [Acidobacteriota bacterium]